MTSSRVFCFRLIFFCIDMTCISDNIQSVWWTNGSSTLDWHPRRAANQIISFQEGEGGQSVRRGPCAQSKPPPEDQWFRCPAGWLVDSGAFSCSFLGASLESMCNLIKDRDMILWWFYIVSESSTNLDPPAIDKSFMPLLPYGWVPPLSNLWWKVSVSSNMSSCHSIPLFFLFGAFFSPLLGTQHIFPS